MKTANFTLHFWGLLILGLPMETVSGFSWFYDRHAVGMCMEFIAAGRSRNIEQFLF